MPPPALPNGQIAALTRLLTPFAGARAEAAAGKLLARFGSQAALLSATPEAIDSVLAQDRDIGRLVVAARELVVNAMRESLTGNPVDLADRNFLNYIQVQLRGRPEEELHVIFLDHSGAYLRDETIALGSAGRIQARFRPLFRRALELNAIGIILAHNHPSGDPRPSKADIQATHAVRDVGAALEIFLVDHLIVAGSTVTSMARAGLL
ncbi:MAG: JAB domain-containing protein [Novosphingobium sp.]